ncbi:MAG: MGMT family protein [Halieaceae bacterium]|nr:MGMT family protein [Halieaceae bacterium]
MKIKDIESAIEAIPEGKVRTYRDISPKGPGHVGWVQNRETSVHGWHRVVCDDGSLKKDRKTGEDKLKLQRRKLREEGVLFKENGKVNLKKHQMPG